MLSTGVLEKLEAYDAIKFEEFNKNVLDENEAAVSDEMSKQINLLVGFAEKNERRQRR